MTQTTQIGSDMKMKTSELIGVCLNFAVAKAAGVTVENSDGSVFWGNFSTVTPSTSWQQGGPIIERENITVQTDPTDTEHERWSAFHREMLFTDDGSDFWRNGPTPLIAAMRCFVSSKLGNEVDIPEELI